MTDLKCSAVNCAHNCSRLCSLSGITVGGSDACESDQTSCRSFSEGGAGMQNSIASQQPSEKTRINCHAVMCVYNKDRFCTARSVEIDGYGADRSDQTMCSSFSMK